MKKLTWFLVIVGFLILIFFVVNSSDVFPISRNTPIPLITPIPQISFVKVIKVFDGDTIEVIEEGEKASGPDGPMARRVRYIGIDTTEVYPKVECYSQEAKRENEDLVLGKTVRLEKDVSETDKYGRLLRYVYIDDKFVNDELIKKGYAKIFTFPPDVRYKDQFLGSEKYARENTLGLWKNCKN